MLYYYTKSQQTKFSLVLIVSCEHPEAELS